MTDVKTHFAQTPGCMFRNKTITYNNSLLKGSELRESVRYKHDY